MSDDPAGQAPAPDSDAAQDPTELPARLHTGPVEVPASVYVAPGACLVGDVRLGPDCSIWYNAVVRGDVNHVAIGARSNIQDGCILHVTNAEPCVIGEDVTVGHGAKVHACIVEEACLIGIGAIVLSGARIGRGSIVGAGAVVREGEVVEPFSLVVGVPARTARVLPQGTAATHRSWARKYVGLAAAHRAAGGG